MHEVFETDATSLIWLGVFVFVGYFLDGGAEGVGGGRGEGRKEDREQRKLEKKETKEGRSRGRKESGNSKAKKDLNGSNKDGTNATGTA